MKNYTVSFDMPAYKQWKESKEERNERIKYASTMQTKVINSKKMYKRNEKHKRGYDVWDY